MDRKVKRPRPGEGSGLDDNPQKRQAATRNDDDSATSHISQEPGARSEFHGTGIQHSGSGTLTARDIFIGSTSSGELEREFLRDLRVSDPRDDKERIVRTKGGLLRDSYYWILDHDDFCRWQDDEQNRLLWVKGDPGKGKTMLLCGIINELEKRPEAVVLSYFFCQATDVRLKSATAVLRGLIYLLLDQQPSLIERLRRKYDHAGKHLFEDINSWDALSKMLMFILQDLGSQTTYLVIDALDECETGLSQLLHLIVQVSSTYQAKWLLSSRNRRDIEQIIRPKESQTRLSLELKENAELVSRAVNTYISQCISQLPVLEGNSLLQDQIRREMQLKANGTFLWVSLVIQELREAEGWEVMSIINDIPAGLDELYERMVRQIQSQVRDRPECCWKLLSTVTAAYRPLHLEEIRVLVHLPRNVSTTQNIAAIAGRSGSFLTIRDDVVYIIHQSAKDFLVKHIAQFTSGLAAVHNIIALQSIKGMSETLQRDIYDVREPGFPITQVEPPDPDPLASVEYSCVYWVSHLADGLAEHIQLGRELQDGGPVHAFLEKHILHWLEALSLLKSMSEGILQMSKLANLTQSSSEMPKLTDLVRDGLRFIRSNRAGIELSPLQVYTSALIFCPNRSTIREIFRHEEPEWITTKPAVEDNWNACLQTLEGHKSAVSSVLFCGGRMQLVSGSWDLTVKIWDSATGQCLQTLQGHTDEVSSVALSSDRRHIASGSWDCTIKIWDSATGCCLKTLEGHTDEVHSVAFFSAITQLASASADNSVKIWNITTGHCLKTLKGHTGRVFSVALSSDDRQLASGSGDCTVRIWDSTTGHCIKILEGHTSEIHSIAFSGDSMQLASGSEDETIKIWDRSTGQCVQTLTGHTAGVNSVIFSVDGMQLASATGDQTIKIWDRSTGQCVQKLTGHTNRVNSIAFTGNGKQLVSASYDGNVKIWDIIGAVQYLQTLEGHTGAVGSIAFSDDNTQLVSASLDGTIKTWDSTGRCSQTLEGHTRAFTSVAFLDNDTKLVSSSEDGTIKIWDNATGRCLKTLRGHNEGVSLATLSVTDRATDQCLQTKKNYRNFQSTFSSITAIQLVSASWDNTVKIWDSVTGYCLQTLIGHTGAVYAVAFSSDSTQLASASEGGTVKIWDIATGKCLQTLQGVSTVFSVAFSSDGTQLASASFQYVEIWERSTGQCRRTLQTGHSLYRISFSRTDLQLYTDIGTIDLRHNASAASPPPAGVMEIATFCGYSISPDNVWIRRDSENVLWLPPEYRPICSAVRGSTVALGCGAGQVLVLGFREDDSAV